MLYADIEELNKLRDKIELLSAQLVAANKELADYRRGMTTDSRLEQENKDLKERYAYLKLKSDSAERQVRELNYRHRIVCAELEELQIRYSPLPPKSEEQEAWEDSYDNIHNEDTRKALLTLMEAVSE